MNRFTWTCLSLIAGMLLAGVVSAGMPESLAESPTHKRLREAASVADPAARQAALSKAMRETLLSSDKTTRVAAFDCFANELWSVNPLLFEEIWLEYDRLEGRAGGAQRLDFAELRSGSRESRLRTVGDAIVNGSAKLRRGTILRRDEAMRGAALQGLDELESAVLANLDQVAPDLRRAYRLDLLPLVFSLRGGAADLNDAMDRAARRLAEMDAEIYRRRMRDDEGFRAVVMDVVVDAARRGRPTPNRPNPAWESLNGIVERDRKAEQDDARVRAASVDTGDSHEIREAWLQTMAERLDVQ